MKELAPFSLKPVALIKGNEDTNTIIQLAIEKASYMFFYTSGPKESHAWFVPQGTEIISCAGKIHSDLARGFIKGDVVSYQEYLHHHNFNECKAKGVAKTVEKNYIVQFLILGISYVTLDFISLMVYGITANKIVVWLKANPKTINYISSIALIIIATIAAFIKF